MYTQEISRATPSCFLFLLDQSYSMEEPLGGTDRRKCDELCNAINGWLQNMIIRASGGSGVRDWMHVGVVGYRTDLDANPIVGSAYQGALAGQEIIPISQIDANPARVEDKMQQMFDQETGEMSEFPVQVPVWIDPVAIGGTPMCTTLHYAYGLLEKWIAEHRNSFPPIVVHITDGESSETDPIPYAEAVTSLSTDDGNVMMFNCHLSMMAADQFLFPSNAEIFPEPLARQLFQMSSILPQPIYDRAVAEGFQLQPGARGMVYNADMISLLQFLDMGTRIAKNLR